MDRVCLVTGGAGFIGSTFVRQSLSHHRLVVNFDKLTYAANQGVLKQFEDNPRHIFVQGDIADGRLVRSVLERYRPLTIVHFAAETHVDRSILDGEPFILSNIVGTYRLLEATRDYYLSLNVSEQAEFRFLHISTDEVFGPQAPGCRATESSPYNPSSYYSASKAAADHLVNAANRTYGLPVIVARSTNNFGPSQHNEKLIPKTIDCAINKISIPIFGDGRQRRNWLFVEDHCRVLSAIIDKGQIGQSYNIGSSVEMANVELVEMICDSVDRLIPGRTIGQSRSLITMVKDRPGHDRRYQLDTTRLRDEIGFTAETPFNEALETTVQWYFYRN
jgi:dTDP-glucose 4,6-dehydratase